MNVDPDDQEPAAKIEVSRQALIDATTEAGSMALMLDEAGLGSYAETLRRWVVGPLDAELTMADDQDLE